MTTLPDDDKTGRKPKRGPRDIDISASTRDKVSVVDQGVGTGSETSASSSRGPESAPTHDVDDGGDGDDNDPVVPPGMRDAVRSPRPATSGSASPPWAIKEDEAIMRYLREGKDWEPLVVADGRPEKDIGKRADKLSSVLNVKFRSPFSDVENELFDRAFAAGQNRIELARLCPSGLCRGWGRNSAIGRRHWPLHHMYVNS